MGPSGSRLGTAVAVLACAGLGAVTAARASDFNIPIGDQSIHGVLNTTFTAGAI